MSNKIEIIREVRVYENAYGCLYDDDVEFPHSGHQGKYVRWEWSAPYSVAVLPMLSATDVGLVESFRHSARSVVLEVPKGFGVSDQDPLRTAETELREELGLRSGDWEHVGTVMTDPAFCCHPMHLFIARQCASCANEHEPSEAIIGMRVVSILDCASLLRRGVLQDAVSLLLVSIASNRLED